MDEDLLYDEIKFLVEHPIIYLLLEPSIERFLEMRDPWKSPLGYSDSSNGLAMLNFMFFDIYLEAIEF